VICKDSASRSWAVVESDVLERAWPARSTIPTSVSRGTHRLLFSHSTPSESYAPERATQRVSMASESRPPRPHRTRRPRSPRPHRLVCLYLLHRVPSRATHSLNYAIRTSPHAATEPPSPPPSSSPSRPHHRLSRRRRRAATSTFGPALVHTLCAVSIDCPSCRGDRGLTSSLLTKVSSLHLSPSSHRRLS